MGRGPNPDGNNGALLPTTRSAGANASDCRPPGPGCCPLVADTGGRPLPVARGADTTAAVIRAKPSKRCNRVFTTVSSVRNRRIPCTAWPPTAPVARAATSDKAMRACRSAWYGRA